MIEYTGAPFQYNPAITNTNIDNQLAAILSQFDDDYIMDIVKDSIDNRFQLYNLPKPNVINSFEITFKQLTDGFSANSDEILETRRKVYWDIINYVCDYYELAITREEDMDYYSAAYWIYDFLVSNFTEHLKNFYTIFLINNRESIYTAFNLGKLRKENDSTFIYSKKLFKDPKLSAIHCNLENVIFQIDNLDINLQNIVNCVYQSNPNTASYILSIISDPIGKFFKSYYQSYVKESKSSTDVITSIKLSLQQMGGEIEYTANN